MGWKRIGEKKKEGRKRGRYKGLDSFLLGPCSDVLFSKGKVIEGFWYYLGLEAHKVAMVRLF